MFDRIPATYSNSGSIQAPIEIAKRKGISRAVIEAQHYQVSYALNPSIAYKECYIESIAVPHIWNEIPEFNLHFIDHVGGIHDILIPPGGYFIDTFLQTIITALNNIEPGYTSGVNTNWTWFINHPGPGPFTLRIDDDIVQQRSGLIGTHVSDVNGNITSLKYNLQSTLMCLRADLTVRGQGTSYDNLTPALSAPNNNVGGRSLFILNFPLYRNTVITQIVRDGYNEGGYFGDLGVHLPIADTTTSVKFTLTDELGVPIDIRPQRWYIVLNFIN